MALQHSTAIMKPEDAIGWEPELRHGETPEQPANQEAEIWLSWKQKSYGITSTVGFLRECSEKN